MLERRTKRSTDRSEALQYLVETIGDRWGTSTVILLDGGGHIVAGMGMPADVAGLARTARAGAWCGAPGADGASRRSETSLAASAIATDEGPLYFAALGGGVGSAGDAAPGVRRIYHQTRPC